MGISVYVGMEDVAQEVLETSNHLFELLVLLADQVGDDDPNEVCSSAAECHSGSNADARVLPFLRRLVAELERVEGDMA